MNDSATDWVLPSEIPISDLKALDLEECVYWLFDSLGARDLQWRIGGSGEGASDGGRDLEATLFVSSPDGEMEGEQWWIECKGRSGTLEKREVQRAVSNAMAQEGLACLVIVTNTRFSNPTRDWVQEWQAKYPRPKIKLWDQSTLEHQLSRHPDVVLRLFAEGLSTFGHLAALRERFWNKLEYAPVKSLRDIWAERDVQEIGPLERLALIANEFAHGNIEQRPWGGIADIQEIVHTLHFGLLNLPYLYVRVINAGVEQIPLFRCFSYLVLVLLQNLSAVQVSRIILDSLSERGSKRLRKDAIEMLLSPILGQLLDEMRDVCTSDCYRVSYSSSWDRDSKEDQLEHYWQRFEEKGINQVSEEADRYIMIENEMEPCKVGFEVNRRRGCPLFEVDPTMDGLDELLETVGRVSEFRLREDRAKRPADVSKNI